jgi:tRNA A37 threonylcarbamoyladenosine synthetase subunit TsaC/SUA5/YrdC
LISTSANRTGQDAPADFKDVDAWIVEQVDMAISGPVGAERPSTIVTLDRGRLICVRDGAVPFPDLAMSYEQID